MITRRTYMSASVLNLLDKSGEEINYEAMRFVYIGVL